MHTALHAVGWSLPRLALALGLAVFVALLAYSMLVFVIVVIEAVSAFGQ